MPKVDVGIACSGFQINNWWTALFDSLLSEQKAGVEINSLLAVSSALPDHNKNNAISRSPFAPETEKKRNDLTDANRLEITRRFLDGPADYLFFVDDDTTHPNNTLTRLINLGREFCGGIYFNAKPPYNPIAYFRQPDGLYNVLHDYAPGTLVQMDSIGMGCTLIHRSVFEKIMDAHTVVQRPDGSFYPVLKELVLDGEKVEDQPDVYVSGGYMHMRVTEPDPEDNRSWPFFALEYGRTEDHYFCELAEHVGIKPWLDTSIICGHWKQKRFDDREYRDHLEVLRESA